MAVWFMQRMEGNVQTEVGPLQPSELLTMVRRGEVQPGTKLRKNDSAWFEARTVGGLFEAAERQEVQYFCPSCNYRIPKPPTRCPKCLRDLGAGEARAVTPAAPGSTEPSTQTADEQNAERSVQSWLKKKVRSKRPR
ncbi:MAG: DUF4339 domain-containing protein [Planctomycetota bacterium]